VDEFIKFVYFKLNPCDDYRSRKHTEEEYIREIMNMLNNSVYWSRYNGSINGKVLNNKHNYYIRHGVYIDFYVYLLKHYLKTNRTSKLKFISTDTTFIQNKFCSLVGRNKYYKNKKGVKISTIVDAYGIPLSIFATNGTVNDGKVFLETYNRMLIFQNTKKYEKNNRYKQYLLADPQYDTKQIRTFLEDKGYTVIVCQNKRNIKNQNLLKSFNAHQKTIYKKRLKVENNYAWSKLCPKLGYVYDKSITSFEHLYYIVSSIILFNRIHTKLPKKIKYPNNTYQ